jgi:hypothetical protein
VTSRPLTQFRVIEALAMADGSVGWCAMIGSRRWLHHQNKGGPRRGGTNEIRASTPCNASNQRCHHFSRLSD